MMWPEIMWWQEARPSHEGHSQCLHYAAASLNTFFFLPCHHATTNLIFNNFCFDIRKGVLLKSETK